MFLQHYFVNWLDKRIPAANEFSLNHRNIFIFPSKFGLLYLALCSLLFLLGTNYQNNLMLLLCYFLLAVFLVTLLTSYSNFAQLKVKLGRMPEVFAHDEIHLSLWCNADSANSITQHGIVNVGIMGQKMSQWFDADTIDNPLILTYQSQRRGWHTLPRITFSTYYPLGLYKCWTHLAFSRKILVYPKPVSCGVSLQHVSSASNIAHDQHSAHHAVQNNDDFSHLKIYQQGEPLHHVAWKQLAKGRGMYSKQFDGLEHVDMWLLMPTCSSSEVEEQLGKLCHQVQELSRQGHKFGLDLHYLQLSPDTGESHRTACLKALALYPHNYQSSAFAQAAGQ
ncbi:DUF58 domain-containing protein [Paraglaciecola sp.]|uniref:DUF58 domain-containing protein n=1 Tax=Paraglaciecola sp. TaxID=1920173 RepID=UPI00273D30C5|nr:DUF58 domain-containing protein [Paraglaciecola sp.]MDP5031241.1 DUF58 domain-containing protein [Paraglaciecola sp.]